MPQSKRKPRTALTAAKNRIRGSEYKLSTVNSIRSTAPSDILFPMAQWSSGWLSALGIVAAIKPRTVASLNIAPFLEPIDLKREITWLKARFEKGKNILQKHAARLIELDQALIRNEAQNVQEICLTAKSELGASMHWESISIGVLQTYFGLEEQKKYVRELREQGASRMLRFFSFWWSVRAEDNTSTGHYIEEILRMLSRADLDSADKCQIVYYLLNVVPEKEQEHSLIAVAASSAVIDAYEIMISLCQAIVADGRSLDRTLCELVSYLSNEVNDPRLDRLSATFGRSALRPTPYSGLSYQTAELAGKKVAEGTSHPSTPLEFFAFCRIAESIEASSGEFYERLSNAVRDIGRVTKEHADIHETLSKYGMVLGATPFGKALTSLASLNSANTNPSNFYQHTITFLNCQDSILEGYACLPETRIRNMAGRSTGDTFKCAMRILSKGQTGDDEDHSVSIQQRKLLRLKRAEFSGDQSEVLSVTNSFSEPSEIRAVTYSRVSALIGMGKESEAIKLTGDLLVTEPAYIHWLPSSLVLECVYHDSENRYPERIDTSIILDVYERFLDNSISSFTAYAAEDFATEQDSEKPTEVVQKWGATDVRKLIYYLHRICEPERLRFFGAFESELELEGERIDICLDLADLDPEKSETYETEARAIVTGRLVKEALKQLQASKISIDEPSLRNWAHRNLREEFLRYQEFYNKGLVPIGEKYRQSLLDALETGSVPADLFDVPQNEAISLFREMVTRFVNQCTFDSEHGLDCYLSLRIRHGTTSGILRSAVEREHIVTRKSKETGEYLQNQHWLNALGDSVSEEAWVFAQQRLNQFSVDVDDLISRLITERIQIKATDKKLGLFEISLSPVQIYSIVVDIDETTDFGEFLDRASELFWLSVQLNLVKIREFIDIEFRRQFSLLFENLEQELRNYIPFRQLADAVLRAKNETEQSIDQLRDWFELPAATSSLAFGIKELVAVSVETMQRFHPEFVPEVTVESNGVPPFQGALNLFSDIFFVIFENIYKHSGNNAPEVSISCKFVGNELQVSVTNSLSANIDLLGTSEVVERSMNQINSDEFIGVVRSEGGTGLPKLANLVGVRSRRGHLECLVDRQERLFNLTFGVEARELQIGEELFGEIAVAG